MFDEFWRQEEELDRKFEKQFFKGMKDDEDELHCDEKCITCMPGDLRITVHTSTMFLGNMSIGFDNLWEYVHGF